MGFPHPGTGQSMRRIRYKSGNIQSIIMLSFSLLSLAIMLVTVVVMYIKFADASQDSIIESNHKVMDQTIDSVESYLVNMRQVSDSAYYNVIKENDILKQSDSIHDGMSLLYESNKEYLRSIALYNQYGSLIAAEPVVSQKEDPDVTKQDWFIEAMERMENIHFSTPHVQNLFDDGSMRYHLVISSSRAVELTSGSESQMGVMLVDMDYSSVSRMLERINTSGKGQYYYLCDANGNIIYHPHQIQFDGDVPENSDVAAKSQNSIYDDYLNGVHRKIMVDTISYTGWKLVCVMPYSIFTNKMADVKQFVFVIMIIMAMMFVWINRVIAIRISKPIMKLDDSVKRYENGNEADIYVGGSSEIRHLGYSIRNSYKQNNELMKKIVWEQNERRKSELDVLQSQINPHFLYNTLTMICGMAAEGMTDKIILVTGALSQIFRYSIKGNDLVSLREELEIVKSYLMIQKERFADRFTIEYNFSDDAYDCLIPKMVIQPLVDALFAYLKQKKEQIVVKGKLETAFTYLLNQEKYLRVFLNDGDVPMDNNASERAIRGFCIGKKNWEVIDTINGAKTSAVIYSIAETAKANNLKPYEYSEHLLTVIPEHMEDADRSFLEELLPWSPALPENIRK